MAYEIGFVDDAGTEGLAHWQMLLKIKTFAEDNGWTTLRYLNPGDGSNRELIMMGVGLSGTEQIYIGFRSYHSIAGDYYNLSVAGFTGYVPATPFTGQPGYRESGLCAHNRRIDYWLIVNAQRVIMGLKVGTPVYEVGYIGWFLPYGTPSQYPYPIAVIGTLPGAATTRYSDTSSAHSSGVKGSLGTSANQQTPQGAIRDVMGTWQQFYCLPYKVNASTRRDTGGVYMARRCVLYNIGQVWGELDGLRYIPGFDNVTENTTMLGGIAQVVLQDGHRTGVGDYFLLELR